MQDPYIAEEQIVRTYMQIRLLAGLALVLGPLLIIAAGWVLGHPMPPALSNYYHIEWQKGGVPGALRTMFVCLMVVVGVLMIAYRGFDGWDNWIHNIGGIASIGVAFFPMSCKGLKGMTCVEGWSPDLHAPSAGALFLLALASAAYRGGPRLKAALPPALYQQLKHRSRFGMVLMTLGAATYLAQYLKLIAFREEVTMVIEYCGFLGFGWHWLAMSHLIVKANRDRVRRREVPCPPAEPARQASPPDTAAAPPPTATLIP
ncbi:MAG: hypothetical protein HZB72_05045 [Burkholderiales bacterium]|nr:hypothetical protein [Burkholderiales bacterium]